VDIERLAVISGEKGIQNGILDRLVRLLREEEARKRRLYRKATLDRTLDIVQAILLFLPEMAWRIVLLPILILIDEIKIAIKGEE
jgi:hypothetical protein